MRLLVVDDSAASAEAWALVGSLLIKTKVAASGQPSLPLLRCLAQELGTLLPRVKDSQMQAKTPESRVGEICSLLATRAQDVELSSKSAVEGEGRTAPVVGYPKIYVQALLKQVDSAPFIQESAQVERLILSAHPHDALRKIYVNRFTVHIHALHGVKDEVGQVPIVASIAEGDAFVTCKHRDSNNSACIAASSHRCQRRDLCRLLVSIRRETQAPRQRALGHVALPPCFPFGRAGLHPVTHFAPRA